jgi:hypothetical protein
MLPAPPYSIEKRVGLMTVYCVIYLTLFLITYTYRRYTTEKSFPSSNKNIAKTKPFNELR